MSLLAQLPPPPAGRSGWPWTAESPPPTEAGPWPRITVVTPSYMQGEFLEHTIRSVLLQNYPNLEFFVLDGGSTDRSREIIERYAAWLSGWRCEKDRGQAAAVNEGWSRASGDVVAWINSDDWYHPGVFTSIASRFREPSPCAWVSGAVDDCAPDGSFLRRHPAWHTTLAAAIGFHQSGYYQPGMFWSRSLIEKVGLLDETAHLCFDLDFWARSLVAGYTLAPVDQPVACFRQHAASKSSSQLTKIMSESRMVFQRYEGHLSPSERIQSAAWLREYLSDLVLHVVYGHLREGRRGEALKTLLEEFRVVLALRPWKLVASLIYHVLFRGRPPSWYSA